MKTIKVCLVVVLAVLILIPYTPAPVSATTNLFYEGARPISMGGAFTAVADDENAKWWNPAGMVYLRGWQFDLRSMSQISNETKGVYQTFPIDDIKKVQEEEADGTNILTLDETQDILDYLEDMDEVISMQGAATAGLTLPRLGAKANFALGFSSYARAEVDDIYIQKSGLSSSIPTWVKLTAYELIYDVKIDQVFNLSGAYSLYDLTNYENTKAASVGINIKHLTRYRFTDKHDPKTVEDLLSNEIDAPANLNEIPHASTLAVDLGTLCQPADWMSFSVVAQDIGASLTYTDGVTPLEHIPTNIRVGSAFSPVKYFNKGPVSIEGQTPDHDYDVLIALDADDLGGGVRPDKKYLADKLHAGIEAKYNFHQDLFGIALRAGDNQGFAAYGVGLDLLWALSFDYAYYGNEEDDYQVVELGVTF